MITKIINIEWEMFQEVHHIEGRAVCQDDFHTFKIMREAQFTLFDSVSLQSYLDDLTKAKSLKRNLVYEKYAWMMEKTEPLFFREISATLQSPSYPQQEIIREINLMMIPMKLSFNRKYPNLARQSRPVYSTQDEIDSISFETYLVSELKTYSYATINHLYLHYQQLEEKGVNIVEATVAVEVQLSGYTSLEEANQWIETL